MSESAVQKNSKWVPSLTEIVFVSVMLWLFLAGAGPVTLLGDGDTGWHIRTGEYILAHHSLPNQDLFSFSKAGQTWYAWEWLSDVVFALVHKAGGLIGVVLLAGVLIASTSALLFRYMLWQGSNMLVALLLMLVASSASTIHWLARPHLFSYLLLPVTVWLLEADRRRETRWVYALAGLCVLWTNLHGGFLALIATVGIYLAGSVMETLWTPAAERQWRRPRRYAQLFGLSAAATLVNPYTYHLHVHILNYLRSDFILNHVMEFHSPNFRGEGIGYFEILLFASMAAIPLLLKRKDVTLPLLMMFWAHAALQSARHVLLFVAVAGPVVARELSLLWEQAAASMKNGWLATLREVAVDYGAGCYGAGRVVGWLSPACVALMTVVLFHTQNQERMRAEFSNLRFPVDACKAEGDVLASHRVFTSDQWADYLIYRYYPKLKVFFDGRSDFYGSELGDEYMQVMNADYRWSKIFDRYRFDVALLPTDWPLATTMKSDPNWKVKYDDGKALLLERVTEPHAAGAETAATRPQAGPGARKS
ncbi:MAG TPA: hypothetical protein VEU62_15185 [Bryobacterales bacterium]|nr:hypothetical protein [Bryobacterales bacterium]